MQQTAEILKLECNLGDRVINHPERWHGVIRGVYPDNNYKVYFDRGSNALLHGSVLFPEAIEYRTPGLKIGDGIVDLHGNRGIIRSNWDTKGLPRTSEVPNPHHSKEIMGIVVDYKDTKAIRLVAGHFRQETFAEFLNRPTGFGRIAWPIAIGTGIMFLLILLAGIFTWSSGGWIAVAIVTAILGIIFLVQWLVYTKKLV